MKPLPFTKMHGAGNDFVVLDGLREELPPLEPLAARLCDRHFGIGADQLLVVRPSQAADFRMQIFNADGSQVEMCANGIRCFYKYLRDRGHTDATLGRGEGPVLDAPLEVGGETLAVSSVSMGNPHAVIVVKDPDTAPVERLGPLIERHAAFPNRVNVEFVTPLAHGRIRQRTWERGTGETLACGSGACAAAVVCMLRGAPDREVVVELHGGELEIAWAERDANVLMTGPAAEVYTGVFPSQGG